LTGLFLQAGREIADEYEGRVVMDDRIVDACAMQLVMDPWQFDVIVTTNLFGDILSDQMSGLVGGLGMAPGANIGEKAAILEAVHGSARDIAGKGIANPLALLLAAALMLKHVERDDLANADRADASRPRSTFGIDGFVRRTGIPFFTMQMGKGTVPRRHQLYMGAAALSLRDYVHEAIDQADLIVATTRWRSRPSS
jgi:isocitrate/isopropylmalate dehydrogenase/thiamine pyrophosphate-dependent enzyme